VVANGRLPIIGEGEAEVAEAVAEVGEGVVKNTGTVGTMANKIMPIILLLKLRWPRPISLKNNTPLASGRGV